MKGNQAALKEGMKAQTISSAITSGVMAGVSAKMAGGKTPADGTAVEGAGEVAKAPSKYVKSAKQNKSLASEIGIDTSKFKGNENLESVFNKKIEAGDFAEGIKGQSGATYDIGKATSWDTLTDSTKEKIFHAGEHTKLGTEHIAGKIPGLDKEFAGLSPEYGYKNIFKSDAGIGRQMQSNLANTLQGWGNLAKVGQNNTLMTMAFGYGMGRNTNRNQGY